MQNRSGKETGGSKIRGQGKERLSRGRRYK